MHLVDNGDTTMSLIVLGGVQSEIFQGVAPGPHPTVKVPFVIVRRKGEDVRYISLFIPSKGNPPVITISTDPDGTITVHGAKWKDTITLGDSIQYHRK